MSYTITPNCIGCQRCLSACPTGAIATDGNQLWIQSDRCNQCQGSYGVTQCWAVCPVNDACVPLPSAITTAGKSPMGSGGLDYWDNWFAAYTRLMTRLQSAPTSGYWRQWFDTYAQTLRRLQTQTP